MNRDPFLRLALIVFAAIAALGLVGVWVTLGPWAALFTAIGGFVFALGVTYQPPAKETEPQDPHRRQRQPAEGTRGFGRVE